MAYLSDRGSECDEMEKKQYLIEFTSSKHQEQQEQQQEQQEEEEEEEEEVKTTKRCCDCGTTTTPLWRWLPGPAGPKSHSVCNACGLRERTRQYALLQPCLKKKKRKKKKTTTTKKKSNHYVPSSSTHSNDAASFGPLFIADDDAFCDLNFTDADFFDLNFTPPQETLPPPLPSETLLTVEAARCLVTDTLKSKSLYNVGANLHIFLKALTTLKAAAVPDSDQVRHLDEVLKEAPEAASKLVAANDLFLESKAVIEDHNAREAALKLYGALVKKKVAEQKQNNAEARKLAEDIATKEAELAQLIQKLIEISGLKEGGDELSAEHAVWIEENVAVKESKDKALDAERNMKAADNEAYKLLKNWEAFVESRIKFD